jgi:hypothetical protein
LSRAHPRTWTQAQRARRRSAALDLARLGYGVVQISEILGIHSTVVTNDLDAVWPDRPRGHVSKKTGPRPVIDWESDPATVTDIVMPAIRSFIGSMSAINYRNALAYTANEAIDRNDTVWLTQARETADRLAELSSHLIRIIDEEPYRKRMASTSDGRDDLAKGRT